MQATYVYCHLPVLECSDCWIVVINMRLSMIWCITEASQSSMLFRPKVNKCFVADLYLSNGNLQNVNSHKYQGVILEDGNRDKDVTWQLKMFHINANLLLIKFGKCPLNTKLELFSLYCTNMYCGIFGTMPQKVSYQIAPLSHTTIVLDASSVFRTIAVQVKCLYPVTFLPSQKLQGR